MRRQPAEGWQSEKIRIYIDIKEDVIKKNTHTGSAAACAGASPRSILSRAACSTGFDSLVRKMPSTSRPFASTILHKTDTKIGTSRRSRALKSRRATPNKLLLFVSTAIVCNFIRSERGKQIIRTKKYENTDQSLLPCLRKQMNFSSHCSCYASLSWQSEIATIFSLSL